MIGVGEPSLKIARRQEILISVGGRVRVAEVGEDLLRPIGEDRGRPVERHERGNRALRRQPDIDQDRCGEDAEQREAARDRERIALRGGRQQVGRRRFTRGERRRERIAARQGDGDGERRRRTLRRIAREAAQDHALHRRIEVVHDRRGCRYCAGVVQLSEAVERLGLVGTAAGEDLEEDQPQRVNVALGRRRISRKQLRRHVLRRPSDLGAGIARGGRDAEVGDAHVAVAVEHHVGRLEVAMEDAALVRRGDARAQLPRDVHRFVGR